MSENGVKTNTLISAAVLDEVLGNRSGSTVLTSVTSLARQLLGSGPLADAVDAAFVNADIYENTVAGLADTVEGEQFQVASGSEIIRYQHESGLVATEVARYPTKSFVQDLEGKVGVIQAGLAAYTGDDDLVPIIADQSGRVLFGVDKSTGDLFGNNIGGPGFEQFLGEAALARYIGDGPVWPIVTDASGRVVLGFDQAAGELVGAIGSSFSNTVGASSPNEELLQKIVLAAHNGALLSGQSLSVGANTGAPISIAQPYFNITFTGGPRAWDGSAWTFTGYKLLVEDNVSPAPDGGGNRSETPCSGLANYASTHLALAGTVPMDHVIFTSTAGHGGYRIDQLDKGTAWYDVLTDHIQGAYDLENDYALHVFGWIQGENDVNVTDFATYFAALEQLQSDVETDAKAITGQTHPVYMITYQVSFGAALNEDIALAQLKLAQTSEKVFLSTPTYHLDHATDNVHLTAIGSKLLGAYKGRAYAEIVRGFKPKWLNPVSATMRGKTLQIAFEVPTLPLQLDVTNLAATTDYGFSVLDDGVEVTIAGVSIDRANVVITLEDEPSGSVEVRYALDNLGAGLSITNGASGNLRDSTSDTISISGTTYQMYHVAPSFKFATIKLSE